MDCTVKSIPATGMCKLYATTANAKLLLQTYN